MRDLRKNGKSGVTADPTYISQAGVIERAPQESTLTNYDRTHLLTYSRLLDAERDGYGWAEAAAEILDLDIVADRTRAEACWRSHLDRAHWLANGGFAAIAPEQV